MEIIVKPKNICNLDKYIKMKANAFIFGMKDLSSFATSIININSLTYLKRKLPKEIKIFVSIDKNIFDEDIPLLKKTLLSLENINIDGILFYDLGILKLKKDLNLKTPFIWNQNFFVTNYEICNYYNNKFDVKDSVLSNEITLDEIKEIALKTKNNLFVNVFGYQLMAYSKRKLLSSYFKYLKRHNFINTHYIIDKNIKYLIKEEKFGTAFVSPYILNYIKEINTFKEIGIKYLILDERGISKNKFLEILNIYSLAIKNKLSLKELQKYEEEINKILNNTSSGFLYKKTIYKVK